MKKTIQKLLSGAILAALLLAVGLPMTALADDPTYDTDDAYLVKKLNVDTNTTLPNTDFTFTFDAVKVNDDAATATNMPEIDDVVWNPTTAPAIGSVAGPAADGSYIYSATIAEILTGVTFTHAGVYEYDVEETTGSFSGMTYDTATYKLYLYIENDGAGGFEPTQVIVERQTPTPVAKVVPTLVDASGGFLFVNTYVVKQELQVKKLVAGDAAGDYSDLTRLFDFTVQLTGPAATPFTNGATVTAKIYNAGTQVTRSPNTVTFTFASNVSNAATLKLAHGDYLYFSTADGSALPVGTTYTVNEAAAAGYQPSAALTTGGTAVGTPVSANRGDPLTVDTVNCLVDEGTNSIVVTNTYKNVAPTGLLMNLLPFIVIIVLVSAGLLIMLVSKRRKSAE